VKTQNIVPDSHTTLHIITIYRNYNKKKKLKKIKKITI